MKPGHIVIIWPNGTKIQATTAEEAEDIVRNSQFEVLSKVAFREMMCKRIKKKVGIVIDQDGSSLDFLYELERGQVLTVGIYYEK